MRAFTLMGMSGVGKTVLSQKAPQETWFHYGVDYRIGTRYLNEEINDSLLAWAMEIPALAALLRSDSIYIGANLSFSNLGPLSHWVGKIGDPNKGGLPLAEFKRRQLLHREAEIAALLDIEKFMDRAQNLYGYENFLVDAGGSLIEVVDVDKPDDDPVLAMLQRIGTTLYIEADPALYAKLVERSLARPKPMYYHPEFLDVSLDQYLSETGIANADLIEPDDFVRWIIPKCTDHRTARHRQLITRFGCKISSTTAMEVQTPEDFERLLTRL